jgi:LacI family transcriptional regulator
MKTTTIFEISKLLNISPSTVSRALRDHINISPETKARVLEMAKKLDYEPNLFAVGLRQNNSKEIAIIAPSLSGFFYDSFISSAEVEAKKHGFSLVILLSGDDPEVEQQNLKTCKQRRVSGIMVCVTSKTMRIESFQKFASYGIPIIFFDKVINDSDISTACVDDENSATLAAQFLLKHNKRSILSIFGDINFSISKKRLAAYQQVFEQALKNDQITIKHALSSISATEITLSAFKNKNKPDAIFCMSDEILIGVMKAIQMLDLKIPRDIGVIAISNGFFPKLYHPEITYIETSGYKLGELAFNGLLRLINKSGGQQTLVQQSFIIDGGSL